jgi:phosphatidylserine/phosphatidylglycerophosphate/cardiolipin synthase-like enzyme
MESGTSKIIEMAVQAAALLPTEVVHIIARAIRESPRADSPAAKTSVSQDIPHPYYRDIATDFLNAWKETGQHLSSEEVALILLTAEQADVTHRKSQSVELVWTGPDAHAAPFRRTEQAILQVLDSAKRRITLVSYAVYRIPHVAESLVQAARRGVKINVIVETPHKVEGQDEYDTIRALGDDVASCARVFYWPHAEREHDHAGKHGILHVKCAVADGRWLFLSSANLTEHAFSINMELGMLVTGGPLPVQVQEQFDRLIANEVLARV